jgi:hypothetical protein
MNCRCRVVNYQDNVTHYESISHIWRLFFHSLYNYVRKNTISQRMVKVQYQLSLVSSTHLGENSNFTLNTVKILLRI